MSAWTAALCFALVASSYGCAPDPGKSGLGRITADGGAGSSRGGASGEGGPAAGGRDGGLGFEEPPDAPITPIFDPGEGGIPIGRPDSISKIDLLFVLDDSISMADKHQVFSAAVPDLLGRLANPVCMDRSGKTSQPASPKDTCPEGMSRQFRPVNDIHIGLITSSLGSEDGENCSKIAGEDRNDGAYLVGSLARAKGIPTYGGQGFLAWDPEQSAEPGGEKDLDSLVRSFRDLVSVVGEEGCGFEAPLEAWYRFLVDPEPPSTGKVECADAGAGRADASAADAAAEAGDAAEAGEARDAACESSPVDRKILAQRSAFLRKDSVVIIVVLTDENDCSMDPSRGAAFATRSSVVLRAMPKCAEDPDDPCCHSCFQRPPAGCPDPADEPLCNAPLQRDEDKINLRCFDPKRRIGFDPLYPVQRYLDGLTKKQVPNAAGDLVDNPLFAGGQRGANAVFLVGIVGVPWQDVATSETLASLDQLRLKSADQLARDGVWDMVLGEASAPPGDALMISSITPRTGKNPVLDVALAPPTAALLANPINGHERDIPSIDDLQYSCIFPLPEPRDSSDGSGDCEGAPQTNPLCQADDDTYDTIQRYAKAYPAPRVMELLRRFGTNSVLASICPKNASDDSREDYGYRPVIGATIQDVAPVLIK